jgi:DNA-binding NarL/FixJ family response regulator
MSSITVLEGPVSGQASAGRQVDVLVVEHETLTRTALAELVARDARLCVAATASSVDEAAQVAADQSIDVVLSGLFLPDGDACVLYEQLTRLPARPEMVVLSQFATAAAATVCRSVGIRTCLSREAPPECVLDAIVAAASRKPWAGPGAVAAASQPPLTYLQTQILAQVASGESNDTIARCLGYSVNYVKDLIAAARSSIGARDRAHAASLSVALRLVRPVGEGRFVPALPSLEQFQLAADRRGGSIPVSG